MEKLEAEFKLENIKLKDLETALNESSIVSILDQHGSFQFVNENMCEISKYSSEELIGKNFRILHSGYHNKAFFTNIFDTVTRGEVWHGEFKKQAKNGSHYWVEMAVVPFLDNIGEPYQYIVIEHDITKNKYIEEKMKQMAYFDPLTSLPNRNYLNKWVNEELSKKKQKELIAILFLDLDRFKSVNDNYGHNTGDLLLIEVGKRIKGCLRSSDFVLRQGGDEFILVLDGISSREEVISIVTKITNQLSLPFQIKGNQLYLLASIGISIGKYDKELPDCHQFIETLLIQADNAMYHAKKQGGGSYCFNTPNQNQELATFYKIEQEFMKGIELKQFYLEYQPLVRLGSQEVIGVEALLRWENPQLGKVPPNEFIPVLEEMGQIVSVGLWVLSTACRQMKQWLNMGIHLERIAVNISPIQFRNKYFVEDVKEILRETGLAPEMLELEVTEGTILNADESFDTLMQLKESGVKISIDDFGTGYSSLSYLKRLPIDTIKIDKSFIDGIDMDSEFLVNTIITMGKNLNFNIIAEGIENEMQLYYLKKQDCHEGQGYYFSKPTSPDAIPMFFKEKA